MPCSGSMANCITLVRIVMAPTAMSPPYLSREALKHTEMTLSLACIVNVARPSATHGRMSFGETKRFSRRRRKNAFFPHRNTSTHAHDSPCESTVASAAPRTPMPSAKMKIGSRMMFAAAPMSTVYMPILAKPCAVMKAFMPSVSSTKSVPNA